MNPTTFSNAPTVEPTIVQVKNSRNVSMSVDELLIVLIVLSVILIITFMLGGYYIGKKQGNKQLSDRRLIDEVSELPSNIKNVEMKGTSQNTEPTTKNMKITPRLDEFVNKFQTKDGTNDTDDSAEEEEKQKRIKKSTIGVTLEGNETEFQGVRKGSSNALSISLNDVVDEMFSNNVTNGEM